MRQPQYTLTRDHVQAHAAYLLQTHLHLRDHSRRCPVQTLLAVLFTACATMTSLYAACRRLLQAPCDETVRQTLWATLPGLAPLQCQINRAWQGDLPKALRRRRQPLAVDIHLIPYHGRYQHQPAEVCRSRPRDGTSHFHAYATAYVIRKGRRYTAALTSVQAGESWDEIVRRLLREAAKAGVRPRLLLLDRGFFNVAVVRYLQAARVPFLIQMPCRGHKPDPPRGPGGTQRLCYQRRSGWFTHRWTDPAGRTATVSVCVRVTPKGRAKAKKRPGRRGSQKAPGRPYAFWGWRPCSYAAVSETYRKRFAIETTYRQLQQARIRTSSRSPLLRLLFVGLALLLRNVWVWAHYTYLAQRRRGGRVLHGERLRFRVLLDWLRDWAVALLGVRDSVVAEAPVPIVFAMG
jgi:DDE family transposase